MKYILITKHHEPDIHGAIDTIGKIAPLNIY